MAASIDNAVLRALTLKELPSELNTLRLKASDESITQQLLATIELGSISTSVFGIWIGICQSPVVVQRSLQQKISVHIRHLGIKQLKSGLEGPHWERLWEGIGGTVGLLEIFSDLSVVEVKAACKAIRRCTIDQGLAQKDAEATRKRECVTELFKGLHPSVFPDAVGKSRDLRPLTRYYQYLVPSCTAELVDWLSCPTQEGKWQYVKERELLKHHSETIGKAALRNVFESQSPDSRSKDRLRELSRQYPPISSSRRSFSASMSFSLSLLRKVVETDTREVENHWVVNNLIRPLLRRAVRKRVSWSQTQEVVDVAMQFFEHHPEVGTTLGNASGDFVHMVALCWSRRSVLFEAQLKRLLSMVFGKKSSFEDLAHLLIGVPRSRKYALFQICCQEVMGVDIESDSDLSKAKGLLPWGTLQGMEASQALGLFKRLRRARGDVNLVGLGPHDSVLATRRIPAGHEGDPDINYLVLLNRNGLHQEAEAHATSILNSRKTVTQASASRELRAESALSVWAIASASGSLKLLHETLQWAKRFVRDQLTASRLFSTCYDETYQLLSGFPMYGNLALTPQELRLRVEAANSFMIDMLDLACVGLREPFFRASDWRTALDLFTRTTKRRIELSTERRKDMNISDDDMYYALWEDTIAMLLRVEKLVNREDCKKLGAATISGIVVWGAIFPGATYIRARPLEKSTWKFIDALAEARDHLWRKLRPVKYPDVLTLPAPFPRGLPVHQLLANWHPKVNDLEKLAPYISSRLQRTLFADPEAALKPVVAHGNLIQAIGCFVDSYHYALTAYIPQECEAQEKKSRLLKVWSHAIGPLSEQRMNAQEAVRFWKRFVPWYLQNPLSEILPEEGKLSWLPTIPKSDDPSQVQEWNPLEGRPVDVIIKERRLSETTYIDFCTVGQQVLQTNPTLGSSHKAPSPSIPQQYHTAPRLWYRSEASTLAALLYLDAKYGETARLLPGPFPSSNDVRFPCLFLDEEFLSLEEVCLSDAISYLVTNIDEVPSPLVRKLVAIMVGQLGAKEGLQDAAFSLLRALTTGDRPCLAFDSAIKVILEQPDASSWHRLLFNNGFLQRIPASDARTCISMYARSIAERLKYLESNEKRAAKTEQSEAKSKTVASPVTEEAVLSSKPIIKITTLKSLAQLLNRSTYIGDDMSLDILTELYKKTKHIDVRVSILSTFLSKLEVDRPELWDTVLSALEIFLPLAGSINEREPGGEIILKPRSIKGSVRETGDSSELVGPGSDRLSTSVASTSLPSVPFRRQDRGGPSLEACQDLRPDEPQGQQRGEAPEEMPTEPREKSDSIKREPIVMPVMQVTTNDTWQDESPMLGALISYFVKIDDDQLWQVYMKRIMVPLLDSLAQQTEKWAMLFLEKYAPVGFDISEAQLPSIPKGVEIFDKILSRPLSESKRIPRHILDQLVDYLVFRISPPAWTRTLNQRLEADPALKSLPEVRIWLTLYGSDLNQSKSRPSSILPFHRLRNMSTNTVEGEDDHITRLVYRNAFIEVFKELVWVDGPRYGQLSAFVSTVHVGGPDEDGRAAIEEMIAYVDSLRTKDWERDPVRSPTVLPDTFGWRLKLLAWPNHSVADTEEAREVSSKTIAQQLAAILNKISASVYHIKLQQIQEEVKGKQNAILTALYLGDISKTRLSWLTKPELLRVDLAAFMILQSRDCYIGTLEGRLKELLQTWIASESEEVRRTGYRLRSSLFDANDDWKMFG